MSPSLNHGVEASEYLSALHVLSLYCHLVDRAMQAGDTPDVSCLFHPDAEFTNSFQAETFAGRDAVVQWYHSFLGKRKGQFRFTRHKIYTPCIEFDGKYAYSSCHFDADSLDFNGTVQRMAGRYDDMLEKHDARWVILKRHIDIHYIPSAEPSSPFRGWK